MEPLKPPELQPTPRLVVGETPVYFKTPQVVDGKPVDSFTILDSDTRGNALSGIGTSVLLTQEPSRAPENKGEIVNKPMNNVNKMDEINWDKVSGIRYIDESGTAHDVPKEELSLEQPVPATEAQPATIEPPQDTPVVEMTAPPKPPEAPLARAMLETIKEDPNVITIVGLKAYQARAVDLAERRMQTISTPRAQERADAQTSLWEKTKDRIDSVRNYFGNTLWKQAIGGIYFQEKARQYYMDMLKAAETPFAESSIRLAEARAKLSYDKMLADKNIFLRAGTKAMEWAKDAIGARTLVQKMAIEELRVMKESGELATSDVFEREAKAVRLRFAQDMESADKFVRKNLGEDLQLLDQTDEANKPVVDGIKNLMTRYATGEIADKATFDAEAKQFFQTTLKDAKPELFAQAELYSSSLFDAAESLRARASHEGGLANIDADLASMQIRLGLGQMGEVTSTQPDAIFKSVERTRKIMEWMQTKSVLGPIIFNEATIGSGVAIALSAFNVVKTMPAKVIVPFAGGILAGGAFAGMRKYRTLQREYLTHVREREVGTTFGEHLKKRAWFEQFVVRQRSAEDLVSTLQSTLYQPNGSIKATLSPEDIRTSIATLADIQARKTLSETGLPRKQRSNDIYRIGLIQFSGRENIETQRTALDVASNRALADLSTYVQSHQDEVKELLGGNSFEDFIVKVTSDQARVLKEGVRTLETLDDPTKNILGLISEYAPEADMVKRRFPLGAADFDANAKLQGIDAIYDEFKKQARGEAIKYGITQGVIGAATGAVLHEAFSLIQGNGPEVVTQATQTVKDTLTDRTNAAVFTPEPDVEKMATISLSEPGAHSIVLDDHVYKLPKELIITSHDVPVGPPHEDSVAPLYDAKIDVSGFQNMTGTPDILLADNVTEKQLFEILQKAGLTVQETKFAPTAELVPTDIPNLVAEGNLSATALIPKGYTLEHIVQQPGHADSVGGWNLLDPNKEVVAHGIKFSQDGSITNFADIREELAKHDIELKPGKTTPHLGLATPDVLPTTAETITSNEALFSKENITIESSGFKEGGIWDYFLTQSHGENNVAAANGMKNLFRLYTHDQDHANITFDKGSAHESWFSDGNHMRTAQFGNESVQEINLNSIPNDAHIALPQNIFGVEGVAAFVEQNDLAIKHMNELIIAGSATDAAGAAYDINGPLDAVKFMYEHGTEAEKTQAIILKLGYIGQDSQLPNNPEDLALVYKAIGGQPTQTVSSAIPTPGVQEVANQTVALHETVFAPVPHEITPGTIGSEKPITLPYMSATDVSKVAERVKEIQEEAAVAAAYSAEDMGTRHLGEVMVNTVDTAPYIPFFFPYHRSLESAYVEPATVKTKETGQYVADTMLAPFGNEITLITREQAKNRASQTLVENPNSTLDTQKEVAWYLSTLTPEEQTRTQSIVEQATEPMSETTRAAVLIPVFNQGSQVSQTISNYRAQTNADGSPIDPKSVEYVIYNVTEPGAEDTVKPVIDQIKTDNPESQITYLSHSYDLVPTEGAFKRDMTNAVLTRIAARTQAEGAQTPLPDIAIVQDPGMGVDMPPTYVSSMIDGLSQESVDMIHGSYKYSNEVYEKLPMMFAPSRAYELVDALARHTNGDNLPNVVTGNSAVRASTLAAVGGYNPLAQAAEDRELAWLIQQARQNSDTVKLSNESVMFDPKPMLYQAMQQANMEGDYATMTWQEMADKVAPLYTREQLAQDLTGLYNNVYPNLRVQNQEAFDRNFNFALDSLGLAHEVVDGKVNILDDSKLASAINSIPDVESFARITAQTFADQDKSTREILANIAGVQEPEVQNTQQPESIEQTPPQESAGPETAQEVVNDQEPIAETQQSKPESNLSSPDVIDVGKLQETLAESVEAPQPAPEPLPTGINERIDYVLEKNLNDQEAKVPITPGELMDYIKTSLDIANTRITDGSLTFADDKLHLRNLKAKAPGGEYTFNADLMNDPQKGLVVDPKTLDMKLPLIARLFAGTARNYALNLSDAMLTHVDNRINPIWKAQRIDLIGQKIEITFSKKV